MKTRITRLFDFGAKSGAVAQGYDPTPAMAQRASELARESARVAVAEMMTEAIKAKEQNGEAERSAQNVRRREPISVNAAKTERRHRRRVKISAPVRVRQVNVPHATEFDVTMTSDVSREGILFETSRTSYARGQETAVVFPYRPVPGERVREQRGQVVRVVRASESRYGVAIAFVDGQPTYELTDSAGNAICEKASTKNVPTQTRARMGTKPLVLVVDADEETRQVLGSEIASYGYAVETVPDPSLAVTLLRHRSPVALICEAEPFPGAMPGGGEMSGYDLCVIVRRNPKLGRMPVILTTRTGLPSDFATAHALGATVCVAKPYDLARMGNLLQMLAPVD